MKHDNYCFTEIRINADYTIYGDNEDGKSIVLSYECVDLCYAIAEAFEYGS